MLRRLAPALALAVAAAPAAQAPPASSPATPLELAAAATPRDGQLPSESPRLGTPHVMDGEVRGIAQLGDRIVAVGSFTRVSPGATYRGRGDDLTRRRIVAFDAETGTIDPSFDVSLGGGPATAVDTDGTHLYVGGHFTTVDGRRGHRGLVKLTAAGEVVRGFRAEVGGEVDTLVVRGGRVYVGGAFGRVRAGGNGVGRQGLAAFARTDGRVLASVRVPFRGVYTSRFGRTRVRSIDVTANGSRLVAVGNFTSVGGQPRVQVAVLDTRGRAEVTGWRTARLDGRHNRCSRRFGSFVRDVDLSPDGAWFVLATTGGYAGGARSGTLCDTVSRWSTRRGGGPSWVAYTGGDSVTGVEVARGAVYAGGHMRWVNNPFASDRPGPGAVRREGIAALDPVTGVPLSWNPGRARGVGVHAFLASADGLWIGSDTTRVAGQRRGRIALVPWAGGRPVPRVAPARLPGDLFVVTRREEGVVRQRPVDAAGAPTGAGRRAATGAFWSKVRGAAYIDGQLLHGWSGGGLHRRALDVTTGRLGPRVAVPLRGLPLPTQRLTGLFYEPRRHRLYYTVEGDSRLLARDFSPQSWVLGAVERVVEGRGVDWAEVAGMTLAGDRIVYGSTDGVLRSVALRGNRVAGPVRRLSGDGTWRARALFVPNG